MATMMTMVVRLDLSPTRGQTAAWAITLFDELSSEAENDWQGRLEDITVKGVDRLSSFYRIAGEAIANNDHVHVLRRAGIVVPGEFNKDLPDLEEDEPLAMLIGPSGGFGTGLKELPILD